MPSPSPKRPRSKPYASLAHVPIANVCFPAVPISSPPAIMPRKETMSAVPSYAESCRRTSLPVVTEGKKVDESGAVYCMSASSTLLTGPLMTTPEPGDTSFAHPADPSPSAGRVARPNAGRVAVKHTIPVLLNVVHRQLTQRIKRACNPLALASPLPIHQPSTHCFASG